MPMISEATPIAFASALPDSTDVLIIGGGIVGMSTAYFLAKAGVHVTLCEKGRVAELLSVVCVRNAGGV